MTKADAATEIEIIKRIAYTAGILQGDITIKTLLESLAEGVAVVNTDGRFVLINNRLSQLIGYSKQEIIGQELAIIIPEKYRKDHIKHVFRFFEEPRIRPMGIGYHLKCLKKDGTELDVEISLSSLDTEVGKLGLAFVSDISERLQKNKLLSEMNEELKAYAHTVAHNINNSINSVVGMTDLLLSNIKDLSDNDKLQYLDEISSSSRKVSEIVKELLLFASLKKEEIITNVVENDPLIDNVIKRLKSSIEKTNSKVIVQKKLDSCIGYGPWIEEIWLNYVSNAVKYGGTNPVIEIGSSIENDGFVKYWVSDNGEGLTESQLSEIFNNPQQLQKPNIDGTGLGLSIVQRITTKLNGKVSVSRNEKGGSRFCFYLPKC